MSTLEEVGPRPRSGRSSKKRQRVADTAVSAKANVEPPAVRIDGLPEDHALIVDCGIYERTETVVNGRAVWHQVDSAPPCDTFLFYSTLGSWCVSDEGDMLAGAHQGSMMTESDAATPDAIAETFVVVDDEQWAADAPEISVATVDRGALDLGALRAQRGEVARAQVRVPVAAVDRAALDAAKERAEAEIREALAAAPAKFTFEGLPAGHEYEDSMGSYVLVEDMVVNGRPVWKLEEAPAAEEADDDDDDDDEEVYLYFASSREWFISFKSNAEAGAPSGWLRSRGYVTSAWEVFDFETREWSASDVGVVQTSI